LVSLTSPSFPDPPPTLLTLARSHHTIALDWVSTVYTITGDT
jgi:hypothetical protein